MILIKNQLDPCEVVYTCAGNKIRGDYAKVYDEETGIYKIKRFGDIDVQEEIDSYLEDCDFINTLNNYRAQDVLQMSNEVLDKFTQVVDVSKMPRTKGDMFNLIKQGEIYYNGLPDDIKKDFGTKGNFFRNFGTFGEYLERRNNPNTAPAVEESEVKDE